MSRSMSPSLVMGPVGYGQAMPPRDAAEVLMALEERERRGVFTPQRPAVVVHRLGWGGGVVVGPLGAVAKWDGEGPAVLIIPAQLGPVEKECLEAVAQRI